MNHTKISTRSGILIIAIVAVFVAVLVLKYAEKNQVSQVSDSNIPKTSIPKSCTENKNQKRICKDGSTINRFNGLECEASVCSGIIDGQDTSYYSPFIIDNGEVYYEDEYSDGLRLINGADLNTFKYINTCASMEMASSFYGKDKNFVYTGGEKIAKIDEKSFEYLGLFHNGDSVPYSISIAKDKNHIYFACGTAIDSIDRGSFEIIGNGYSKDKNHVYYLDSTIEKANPKTIEAINHTTDSNTIYGNFALDKQSVYFEGKILKNINPSVCKSKGLDGCLPKNWHDLIDDYTEPTKFNDGVY